MVLQFEDAVDVLQVLYPTFDFVFLFDHNAGHSEQRIGELSGEGISTCGLVPKVHTEIRA